MKLPIIRNKVKKQSQFYRFAKMCGFAGFIDFKNKTSLEVLHSMANSLEHRGPDDSGFELLQNQKFSVGLGFRRLSIIDLSPGGHQPMFDSEKTCVIMMNGEIYNYKEIRSELEILGCQFVSKSDTEVVIYAYKMWGMEMVNKFIGMFAMALFDIKNELFYLIRDRAGVKPLFWHQSDSGFLFGSELKAFHHNPNFKKVINSDAISLFLMNGSIPAPYSIFQNTYKVKPGHWLKINLNSGERTEFEYWNANDCYLEKKSKLDYFEALQETEKIMQSAFDYRMVSDVPVGVFLSGGYDSTAVAALLSNSVSNLNTYTIGFDDVNFDESKHAKKVANHLGTNHNEYICQFKDAMSIISELPEIYDEPFGDPSAIPTTLVSRIARKYVTVALSADAGDELFAGYPRHKKLLNYLTKLVRTPDFIKDLASVPLKFGTSIYSNSISSPDRIEKLQQLLSANSVGKGFNIINQTYTEKEIRRLLKVEFKLPMTVFDEVEKTNSSISILDKILSIEYRTYLVDDILQKVDRATMSIGLEGREPFLDHRLLEFVGTLPDNYKLQNGESKKVLKDIVHKYVPKEIMDRPKMGFGVPIQEWLRVELADLFNEVMDIEKFKQQGIFNVFEIEKIKSDFLARKTKDIYRVWYLFVFQQWYDKWMN